MHEVASRRGALPLQSYWKTTVWKAVVANLRSKSFNCYLKARFSNDISMFMATIIVHLILRIYSW